MIINRIENPHTKDMVDKNTFFRISALFPLVSSSMEKPVIKVKYAGISGNTHGDKKESNPAKKAAEYETDCANMVQL